MCFCQSEHHFCTITRLAIITRKTTRKFERWGCKNEPFLLTIMGSVFVVFGNSFVRWEKLNIFCSEILSDCHVFPEIYVGVLTLFNVVFMYCELLRLLVLKN